MLRNTSTFFARVQLALDRFFFSIFRLLPAIGIYFWRMRTFAFLSFFLVCFRNTCFVVVQTNSFILRFEYTNVFQLEITGKCTSFVIFLSLRFVKRAICRSNFENYYFTHSRIGRNFFLRCEIYLIDNISATGIRFMKRYDAVPCN